MSTIKVSDFSRYPGGRFIKDGPFSGEQFRNEILAPALIDAIETGQTLIVNLDDTMGYGSSFLEEAFGGLIRLRLVEPKEAQNHLMLLASDRLFEPYCKLAKKYLDDAKPKLAVA